MQHEDFLVPKSASHLFFLVVQEVIVEPVVGKLVSRVCSSQSVSFGCHFICLATMFGSVVLPFLFAM